MSRPLMMLVLSLVFLNSIENLTAQDRETKVRNDKALLENSDHWIYNNLPRGLRQAKLTKKPILVVLRCIPCEACHEFDEQVVERDPKVRELLDHFVCVRIPQANGLDLALFQYDYDMSFAVMYLHHDGTLLGRFGTRTGRDNEAEDMQLEGFAESMQRALALDEKFDEVRDSLAGKMGPAPEIYKSPEQYPSLKDKYTDSLDYSGKVVQSCIHCHQIRDADRLTYRLSGQPLPDEVLYPWPSLKVIGIQCDPKTATTVSQVLPNSLAAAMDLQPGDRLVAMNGQPLLSVADAQWVLHRTPDEGRVTFAIDHEGQIIQHAVTLPQGWRQASDISWRVSSWELRRMAFGGMLLKPLPESINRKSLKLPDDHQLALFIEHVGQYGDHARAKQAGLLKGDILIGYDGRHDFTSEQELFAHAMQQKKRGDKVHLEVIRDGQRKTFTITLQ